MYPSDTQRRNLVLALVGVLGAVAWVGGSLLEGTEAFALHHGQARVMRLLGFLLVLAWLFIRRGLPFYRRTRTDPAASWKRVAVTAIFAVAVACGVGSLALSLRWLP
jgi:hypothetical protein